MEIGGVFAKMLRIIHPNGEYEVCFLYYLCFSDSSNFHSKMYSFVRFSIKKVVVTLAHCLIFLKLIGWFSSAPTERRSTVYFYCHVPIPLQIMVTLTR